MATLAWIKSMLDQRNVAYQEVHHTEAFTAQEVAQREHISGHRVAKVVVAMADGQPVALVLPASRRVVLERVRELLSAKDVRLATEDEMRKSFADCEVGAIPPLAHWKNVAVLMDDAFEVKGEILFQAGTHRDAVRLRFDDWFKLVQPRVESFSEPAEAVHPESREN